MDETKQFDYARNPYKAKRSWPPDVETLSHKDQFRLERRYRRRAQLKWARPRFMAITRLTQWVGCLSVLGYGVFFYDWGSDKEAFAAPRKWLRSTIDETFGPAMKKPRTNHIDDQSPQAAE